MKTTKKLLVVAIASLPIVACMQKKVDEQLLKDISTFETEWTTTATNLSTWTTTLKENCGKIKSGHESEEMTSMTKMASTLKAPSKTTFDSLMNICMSADLKCTEMITASESLMNQINAGTEEFTAWKAKVEKVEIETDSAKINLASYTDILNSAKTSMSNWQDGWQQLNAQHDTSMNAIKTLMSEATSKMPAKGKK